MVYWLFRKPFTEVVYLARSYKRSLSEFREVIHALAPYAVSQRKQPPACIELFNGSRVWFLSFDKPENLRGDGADLIVADEAALFDPAQFGSIVRPMLMDRRGICFLCSTFRGASNWFFEEYEKGRKGQRNYQSWLYPTSSGLMFQGEEGRQTLEDFRASMADIIWQQECECVPQANAAAFFRFLSRAVLPIGPMKPGRGGHYIIGIDVGRTVDHTACVVLECGSGQVADVKVFSLGVEHADMARQCALLAAQWNALPVIDATGGASGGRDDSHIKFYASAMKDLRAFTWGRNKEDVLNALALNIERQRVTIPEQFRELTSQLEQFQCEFQNGRARMGAPIGSHDDCVMALAMASFARDKNWKKNANGVPLSNLNG